MERRAIIVRGTVQGVGFRPFVHSLASRHEITGLVRNQVDSVWIEVEADPVRLDQFLVDLLRDPPPLAHIESLSWRRIPARGDHNFTIADSVRGESDQITCISPDMATCDDCLSELFDPDDRRHRYPFLNCTNCGPRLTIIQGAPYDRQRTTMRGFRLCPECQREYENPANRRFHAQPTACPVCGPRLEIVMHNGAEGMSRDPLGQATEVLLRGGIVAIKGIGGYHLACDARSENTVRELRQRKNRDDKPFAIMVQDVVIAERLCELSADECALLESPRRPIVLLKRREKASRADLARWSAGEQVCDAVAPGNPYLGIMLPYTPLHHLLLNDLGGIPLVMTSGNRSDEPIAYLDRDAEKRLGMIADAILRHDRPIHVRCDDSVTRYVDGAELPVRRSRGYAPQQLKLPISNRVPTLAVGGQLKGTFALGVHDHAMLSHHLGDLDHFEAYRQFERDIPLYEQTFRTAPRLIVHDMHPDYASTHYALARAHQGKIPTLAVQHHHAHLASCMAEHGLTEPVIGVIFDGTGFGIDERTRRPAIWGGEFLIGDYAAFRRAAHLRYVSMPGGDKAAKEPWRMAVAHATDAGCCSTALKGRISSASYQTICAMLDRRFNTPRTSSAGRLFDAVASLAGVRDFNSYEAQAAMQLEWLASEVNPDATYAFDISHSGDDHFPWVIDTRPLIREVVRDATQNVSPSVIARRFHSTLVKIVEDVCIQIRARHGLNRVVLSGGVFGNVLLTREVTASLSANGFQVYRHQLVPPNDGGLSLGQLAVAAATFVNPADSLRQPLHRAGVDESSVFVHTENR